MLILRGLSTQRQVNFHLEVVLSISCSSLNSKVKSAWTITVITGSHYKGHIRAESTDRWMKRLLSSGNPGDPEGPRGSRGMWREEMECSPVTNDSSHQLQTDVVHFWLYNVYGLLISYDCFFFTGLMQRRTTVSRAVAKDVWMLLWQRGLPHPTVWQQVLWRV